jgi:hypothetical protein
MTHLKELIDNLESFYKELWVMKELIDNLESFYKEFITGY